MKLKLMLLVITAIFSSCSSLNSVLKNPPPDPIKLQELLGKAVEAEEKYNACLRTDALKYAGTVSSLHEIASAAAVTCKNLIPKFSAAVYAYQELNGESSSEIDKMLPQIVFDLEEKGKELVNKTVLDKRAEALTAGKSLK